MPGVIEIAVTDEGVELHSKARVMRCLLEKMATRCGFELVHDGQKNVEQLEVLPAFYTRVYRLRLDGEFVNTFIRFKYDKRSDIADMTISWKDLEVFKEATK